MQARADVRVAARYSKENAGRPKRSISRSMAVTGVEIEFTAKEQ
jgi:hypothetical protein